MIFAIRQLFVSEVKRPGLQPDTVHFSTPHFLKCELGSKSVTQMNFFRSIHTASRLTRGRATRFPVRGQRHMHGFMKKQLLAPLDEGAQDTVLDPRNNFN